MVAFLIQFVSLFALALWVGGGAAVSFVVAPTVFEKAGSRKLAGEIMGKVFRRLDIYALSAGPIACFAVLLEWMATVGAPRTLSLKLALVGAMVALALYSRTALAPELASLRAELGDELDRLPPEDGRRLAYVRLHGLSILCLMGQILLGAFAIALAVMTSAPRAR